MSRLHHKMESRAQGVEVTPLVRLEHETLVQGQLRADREAGNRASIDRPDREQPVGGVSRRSFAGHAEGQRCKVCRDEIDDATAAIA